MAGWLVGLWLVGVALGLVVWWAMGCPDDDDGDGPVDPAWGLAARRGRAGQGGVVARKRPTPAERAGGPGPRGWS